MSDKPSEQYVSGEEHKVMSAGSHKPVRQATITLHTAILAAVVVVLCALSFWGGINYQKHHAKTGASNTSARAGLFGGRGQRRGGGLGQVTAISDSSITVQNQRTGNSKTYSINSSTAITDDGQTVPASDIKTGDTVVVMAASSGSTTASRILVNPSFGGGAQAGPTNIQSD